MRTPEEMLTLRLAVESEVTELLSAHERHAPVSELKECEDDITKSLKIYNKAIDDNAHEALMTSENPIVDMLTAFSYDGHLTLKKVIGETGELEDAYLTDDTKACPYSLKKLESLMRKLKQQALFDNPNWHRDWIDLLRRFEGMATIEVGGDMNLFYKAFRITPDMVGVEVKDSKGKGKKCTIESEYSIGTIKEKMQNILTYVTGSAEYKVNSEHVRFVDKVMHDLDKGYNMRAKRQEVFDVLIMRAFNYCVTKQKIKIDYNQKA